DPIGLELHPVVGVFDHRIVRAKFFDDTAVARLARVDRDDPEILPMLAAHHFHAYANCHECYLSQIEDCYFRRFSCLRLRLRSSARSFALLRWPVPTLVFIICAPGWNAPILPRPVTILTRSQTLILAICRMSVRTWSN